MSALKATPGPWRTKSTAPGYYSDIYGADGFVARVASGLDAANNTQTGRYRETQNANTDLVLAVHDLYTALEPVSRACPDQDVLDELEPLGGVATRNNPVLLTTTKIRAIRAALKKARGE